MNLCKDHNKLPPVLEYIGEYGAELAVFVPYINYLKENNLLGVSKVLTYNGMRSYYYFLNDDEIQFKEIQREWIPHYDRHFLPQCLKDEDKVFTEGITPDFFKPPDYKSYFKNIINIPGKPMILLQNKFNSEWNSGPINFFTLQELAYILDELHNDFQIIYIRTNQFRGHGYSHDGNESESYKYHDKEFITDKYPDVVLIEQILEHNPSFDFNTFKCILEAEAIATISTLGGYNVFDAYFSSKHIIYKKFSLHPPLVEEYFQNQHKLLCPDLSSHVLFATCTQELIRYIQEIKDTLKSKSL